MTDLSHIKEFGKLIEGDKILLIVDTTVQEEVANIGETLKKRFPGVEFTVIAGPVEIKVMKNE